MRYGLSRLDLHACGHNMGRGAVGSESDCRSRGHKFDPGPFPYFRGYYTPPHFSVGVLCYTFRCLSVRPCSPFPIEYLSIYSRNFFKFCIHIVIGDEWYGIVSGQNPSIFNGVTAVFRFGKMVSGLLFLYCS